MIKKIKTFIEHDIWNINRKEQSKVRLFLIRQLRILLIARKGFTEGRVQLKASALTFYSLLSIVPVVALLFAIAKGFGFQNKMEELLSQNMSGQGEAFNKITEFANKLLDNTSGGYIAGFGALILFWSVMKVLGNIEKSFNDIWQIKKSRPFIRKFSDYFSIMLLAPIFIILSSSLTVFISSSIQELTSNSTLSGYIGPFVAFMLKFIPYALVWFLFTGVYIIMPNTRVRFSSALIGGIIAGTIFQLTQWGYIHFMVSMSKYNAIYGSFAALPLLLVWLQISWLIVLFGAEISFANQNLQKYEIESESLNLSNYYRKILTLLTANMVIKNFAKGESKLTASDIARKLELPIRLVREMIFDLVESGIFSETVSDSPRDKAYQPGIDIHLLTINYILNKMDKKGIDEFKAKETSELSAITSAIDSFTKNIEKSESNKLLLDI